jgi:hypothetical protein
MNIFETIHGLPVWASVLLAVTVSFVLLALVNYSIALFVERRRPPTGRFIEVNGVRLHYTDEGAGRAVVLLHGNGVSGDDYKTSSVAERLSGRTESSSSTDLASGIPPAREGSFGGRPSRQT